MRIPYYQIDAFTSRNFGGNPAGVCLLDAWLPDPTLQLIAAENNLSETAFLAKAADSYQLRWFTPALEIDLCGHATLAPAFLLFNELGYAQPTIRFETRSGLLLATRRHDLVELDFPSRKPVACAAPEALVKGLACVPREVFKSRDYLAVFDSELQVATLIPNFAHLSTLDSLGIIVTAPGKECDFVSRFFAPRAGVPEDPVTGSAHSTLIPFWAERLGKNKLHARQISKRGGELFCEARGDRVTMSGRAVIYNRGELEIPDCFGRPS
jgi:predicted PhzF superfamily epimerase YddE/YHI9